jgi:hypothetical protein
MTVPLTGYVADRIGIESTLMALAGVPLLAAALSLPLPRAGTHRADVTAVSPGDPA